jgi:hypothetical protein
MGHGDQWQAVEQDIDMFLETMISLICKEGTLVGENSFCHTLDDVDKKEGVVFGLQYPEPESPVSFLALGVREIQEGGSYLWTAYPFCAEGPCTRLVVDEVKVWPNGVEGVVETYMPKGDSFGFFDPFFFLNKEKYQEWAEIDVAVSALAYVLQKAEPEAETAEEPPADMPADMPGEPTAEGAAAFEGTTVSLLDPAEYFPCGGGGDSAEIEFIVEEAIPVACIGRLFWRMTGVIMRADNDKEMRIHVYASEQVLKGYVPQPGDDVLAVAWMQGRLLGVTPPT